MEAFINDGGEKEKSSVQGNFLHENWAEMEAVQSYAPVMKF